MFAEVTHHPAMSPAKIAPQSKCAMHCGIILSIMWLKNNTYHVHALVVLLLVVVAVVLGNMTKSHELPQKT